MDKIEGDCVRGDFGTLTISSLSCQPPEVMAAAEKRNIGTWRVGRKVL